MFGDFEEQSKMMEQKMKEIKVNHSSSDESISLTLNGSMEIENINIDLSKIDVSSSDQLEDTLIVTLNEALQQVQQIQAIESQKMLSQMMPGGLGGFDKLFGG